jgi:hypothetical protein
MISGEKHETCLSQGRSLVNGENLVALFGYEHNMLELGSAAAIQCDYRPAIRPNTRSFAPFRQRRLNGEHHSGQELQLVVISEVLHKREGVKMFPHTMATIPTSRRGGGGVTLGGGQEMLRVLPTHFLTLS